MKLLQRIKSKFCGLPETTALTANSCYDTGNYDDLRCLMATTINRYSSYKNKDEKMYFLTANSILKDLNLLQSGITDVEDEEGDLVDEQLEEGDNINE